MLASTETIVSALLGSLNVLLDAVKYRHTQLRSWLTALFRGNYLLQANTGHVGKGIFTAEVEAHFASAVRLENLLELSLKLQGQFRDALMHNTHCMLPSYIYQLPHGGESGTFLALDVGGSTFRIAMIELDDEGNNEKLQVVTLQSHKINDSVKLLRGPLFFDWMVEKIRLAISGEHGTRQSLLPMGLAWSFPIEQTSSRTGRLRDMGKGFFAAEGLIGRDLGEVFQEACCRGNLPVVLKAIINDSLATLLTKAYSHPSTRMGLILGTGVNVAAYLPIGLVGQSKLDARPSSWLEAAHRLIVNTELSMFGEGILQLTPWDVELNDAHPRPLFQPLEHLVSGRYLGEIARLILVDATKRADLFRGKIPESLLERYSLSTEELSHIQCSSSTAEARKIFTLHHPTQTPITDCDIEIIRNVACLISRRASAIIAVSLHALWMVKSQAEMQASDDDGSRDSKEPVVIACCGSVIERYPEFMHNCQGYLDSLIEHTSTSQSRKLELMPAVESSLLGAAVAVALDGA